MAVMAVHRVPSLTQERYEQVVQLLTGKARFESASDLTFEGLVHVAAQTPDGFLIVDVFESPEAFDRFREEIGPIVAEVGILEPPVTHPAHTFVSR